MENQGIVVFTTFPAEDGDLAQLLPKKLLEVGAAACISIIKNVASHYVWEGKYVEDNEILFIIKSTRQRLSDIKEIIKKLSKSSVPEIIALDIVDGCKNYIDWVKSVCGKKEI